MGWLKVYFFILQKYVSTRPTRPLVRIGLHMLMMILLKNLDSTGCCMNPLRFNLEIMTWHWSFAHSRQKEIHASFPRMMWNSGSGQLLQCCDEAVQGMMCIIAERIPISTRQAGLKEFSCCQIYVWIFEGGWVQVRHLCLAHGASYFLSVFGGTSNFDMKPYLCGSVCCDTSSWCEAATIEGHACPKTTTKFAVISLKKNLPEEGWLAWKAPFLQQPVLWHFLGSWIGTGCVLLHREPHLWNLFDPVSL